MLETDVSDLSHRKQIRLLPVGFPHKSLLFSSLPPFPCSMFEEAAIVDGAGHWTIFLNVFIPLSKPALVAICVYAILGQLNSAQKHCKARIFVATVPILLIYPLLAHSLEERAQLLKIMSMNHYDMETGSRPEHLAAFKVAYGASIRTVRACLDQYFPDMPDEQKQDFIYTFFPFMFGIYPYTYVTEKQRTAMEAAGVNYAFMTIYEITYNCVRKLLGD